LRDDAPALSGKDIDDTSPASIGLHHVIQIERRFRRKIYPRTAARSAAKPQPNPYLEFDCRRRIAKGKGRHASAKIRRALCLVGFSGLRIILLKILIIKNILRGENLGLMKSTVIFLLIGMAALSAQNSRAGSAVAMERHHGRLAYSYGHRGS
jgi:hypothetical protein